MKFLGKVTLGMHLRRTTIIAIALSMIWVVHASAQSTDAPELDVEQAIDQYLYGNSRQVAAAKTQLVEAGFDAVYPYFQNVLGVESPEYLLAIQLFVLIEDERVVPVLRDHLLDVSEGRLWRYSNVPHWSIRNSVREDVIEAIASFGYAAASDELLFTDTLSADYWRDVAKVFSNIEGDEATLVLLDLLQSGLSSAVGYAASALARRDPSLAMPHLEIAFKSTRYRISRQSILNVLKGLWGPVDAERRAFALVTADPITDWHFVRAVAHLPHLREMMSDYQRNYLKHIELIPEQYARAIYWCHSVQVSALGPVAGAEPMWDDAARRWVDTNRDAIVRDLMRLYEMWGRIEEGGFSIYPSDAQVLTYLKATESLQWLRDSFVYSPGNRYTGEGSYPFSYSDAGPFPYHSVLAEAIEYLTRKPIAEAIQVTDEEVDMLSRFVHGESSKPADAQTALHRLFQLAPEVAQAESLDAFRRSGPEHNRDFVITIDGFILKSSPTTQELRELLGPPAESEEREWAYRIGRSQGSGFSKGGEYKVYFWENRLVRTEILETQWSGGLAPWGP